MRTPLIHHWWMGGVSYSAEAQAVFTNMPDVLPNGVKQAIATYVDAEVASGNWDLIVDFGYLGLNTQANSLKGFKNVANPSLTNAVWNSYEKVSCNGTNAYINWGFIPNNIAAFQLNNCALGVHIDVNQHTAAADLFGCIEVGTNTRQIDMAQSGSAGSTLTARINAGNSNTTYSSDNIFDNGARYAVRRTASNATAILKAGTVLATGTTASVAKAQIAPFIGARNQDGTPSAGSYIKSSFKYWIVYQPTGFNEAASIAAANQLITDIEFEKLRVFVIGDSIARGTSNGVGSATADTLKEFNGTNFVDIAAGADVATAATGSRYPSLADRIFTSTERVTHIVNGGSGGSDFSPDGDTNNWSTTGTAYAAAKTKANNYLATQPAGTVFDIIIITLGINDVNGATALATIDTDAISLIDRINIDWPNTKIIVNQLGKGGSNGTRNDAVRATIANLVATYSNVHAATDLDTYPAEAFYDGIHLNQAYNNQLGIDDANIIAALL
jgi:hypothetical protein